MVDQDDSTQLRERTLAWVAGWRTSPEEPFSIDRVADLYAQDESLFSYDFGRPANGVASWARAAPYYERFMAIPETWTLTAGDDLLITIKGTIAWATLSLNGEGTLPDGQALAFPEARVTLIFEKRQDAWLIVHEHGSVALPFPEDPAPLLD